MKKSIQLTFWMLAAVLCGCSDWLTIQPETSVTAKSLFKTDVGVKQGLNGVYFRATGGLYSPTGYLGGGGFVEQMANTFRYNPVEGGDGYYWSNHSYDNSDSQETVNGYCFVGLYNMIANLNSLLNEMAPNRENISQEVYAVVRGEALGLRACCHLDVLRIWGPVPSAAEAGKTYVPYVLENDVNNYPYHSFDEYMDYVQADLDSAEMYLATADPVVSGSFEATESSLADWPYRKSRMNYWGVLALQARAALWRGDKERALRYARMVKEAENEDGTPKVRFTTPDDDVNNYSVTDNSHYTEHLCGVKCEEYDNSSTGNPWAYRSVTQRNYPEFLEAMYGTNYKDDLRYKHYWYATKGSWQLTDAGSVYVGTEFSIYKYSAFLPSSTAMDNFPIARLPEMYFVIMECAPLAEANAAYEEYCAARGVAYEPLTEADREERTMMESLREYVAEGQNFFTYKRLNRQQMVGAETVCLTSQYIVPLPEDEYSIAK